MTQMQTHFILIVGIIVKLITMLSSEPTSSETTFQTMPFKKIDLSGSADAKVN